MENNIYIIGSDADKNSIEALRPAISAAGYILNVVDNENIQKATNASNVVLWLTSNTDNGVFEIGQNRKNSNQSTINVFAEPFQLTSEQKAIVGRNQSIFTALAQNLAMEILLLLGATRPSAVKNEIKFEVKHQTPEAVETPANNSPTTSVADTTESVSETEESADNDDGFKPKNAFLTLIVVFITEYAIENYHQFYNDEIIPYIMFGICAFIAFGCAGGVMTWQEKNGKSSFSRFTILVGYLGGFFYSWLFIKNLWNFIF